MSDIPSANVDAGDLYMRLYAFPLNVSQTFTDIQISPHLSAKEKFDKNLHVLSESLGVNVKVD